MTPEKTTKATKICPVCGTKLSESATRCLVCGTALNTTAQPKKASTLAPKKPGEVRMSLPLVIGLGLLLLVLIGLLIFFILQRNQAPAAGTNVPPAETATLTPTKTATPTQTLTQTPEPTWTPLAPIQITVQANEYCSTYAGRYNVSMTSIIQLNNLNADCTLSVGMPLLIPQPTMTPTTIPTNTPNPTEAAELSDRCDKVMPVVVQPGWTLSRISLEYNVSMALIREFNKMSSDIVREGETIIVPLCERKPTDGPTPTPTDSPPYPPPNLLLPVSGSSFSAGNDSVTLQWAAVADLKDNEVYRVTVQDLSSDVEKILVDYVSDTKYIIPVSFRPVDTNPHIIQWTIQVAKRISQGEDTPVYLDAGATSEKRVFSWVGTGVAPTAPAPTPTP